MVLETKVERLDSDDITTRDEMVVVALGEVLWAKEVDNEIKVLVDAFDGVLV